MYTRAHVHLCTCMLVTAHTCVTLGMDTCVHPVCVDVSMFSRASVCTWLCDSFHSLVMSTGEIKMRRGVQLRPAVKLWAGSDVLRGQAVVTVQVCPGLLHHPCWLFTGKQPLCLQSCLLGIRSADTWELDPPLPPAQLRRQEQKKERWEKAKPPLSGEEGKVEALLESLQQE